MSRPSLELHEINPYTIDYSLENQDQTHSRQQSPPPQQQQQQRRSSILQPSPSQSGQPLQSLPRGQLYPNQPQILLESPLGPDFGCSLEPLPPGYEQFSGLQQSQPTDFAPSEYELLWAFTDTYGGHSHRNHEVMAFNKGDNTNQGPQPDGVGENNEGGPQNGENNDDKNTKNNKTDPKSVPTGATNRPHNTLTNPVYATMNRYSYLDKPNFISAILHFRTRQLWMSKDPKMTGFIDVQDVIVNIPKVLAHFEPTEQNQIQIKLKEMLQTGMTMITVYQFYNLLATHLGHKIGATVNYTPGQHNTYQQYQVTLVSTATTTTTLSPVPIEQPTIHKTASDIAAGRRKSQAQSLDDELQNVKKARRRSQFADSIRLDQDINTIAQYEDSKFRSRSSRGCCQCITSYIVCPIAIHRFPFIASVSAKFGSTYVKLFEFISSLMWLNFILALFTLSILIRGQKGFPWLTMEPYDITRWDGTGFETFSFIPKRSGFFFGQGLEQSFLFYSDWYYPPSTDYIGNISISSVWTALPMILFFLSVLFVLAHLSRSNASTMDDSEKLVLTVFSFDHRPKTSYSYKLQGLHLKSTLYSLTSLLREKQFLQQHKQFFGNKINLVLRRILGITSNIIALAGCCVGLILLTINEKAISRTITDQVNSTLIGQWAVPLLISLLKVIIPYIVKFCVMIESRDVIGTFKHNSCRIFLCKIFFIFVVLFQTQNTNVDVTDVDATVTCRQTITAVMLYKMLASDIVMDVAIEIGLGLLFFLWNLIYYKGCKAERIPSLGNHPTYKELDEHLYKSAIVATPYDIYRTEFLAVECLIDMLYTQILVWVGLPFSPVMAFMGAVYFFAQYWARMTQLLMLSRMPKFSVSQNIQTNLLNVFLSLSVAVAILSFTVFFSTNVGCGPHLFRPGARTGNSPAAGLVERISTLPDIVTVLINLLGSPIILLCLVGVLFFIMISYRLIYKQYSKDAKQLGLWLGAERSQIKLLRKQFNLRGVGVANEDNDYDNNQHNGNFNGRFSGKLKVDENGNSRGYMTMTFGDGEMTAEQLLRDKQQQRLKRNARTQQTLQFQRDSQLLQQIIPDQNDINLLTKRAKMLFVDFIQELPDSISASFQFYCVSILWIQDITPLLMMTHDEILLLLEQWNPALQQDSSLTIFFFDLLTRYRGKMLL